MKNPAAAGSPNELGPTLVTDLAAHTLPMLPGREIQELWLALSRRSWLSAVLVPADDGVSAAMAAAALAEVGRRIRQAPVSALMADRLDYDAAAELIGRVAAAGYGDGDGRPASSEQVIVAIPPVVTEPLGVAVAREADVVVLCLSLGRTSLAAARKSIELIGIDRIAGCLLLD